MKIMVGVNTLSVIEQPIYSNHCQFWFRLGRNFSNDYQFALHHPKRMSIDRMRNETAKMALHNEFDYIMFIDDDVLVPFDALQNLLACEADIAAGWTIIRGYPFNNMFFKWDDKTPPGLVHYNDLPEGKCILDVAAVGFSCALIKCSLLHKINPPFFVTGPLNTEDIYFCIKAQKQVPDVKIVVNLNVKTAHMMGAEAVDPDSRLAHLKYYETVYPDVCKPENGTSDRGDEYVKQVKAALV